jgi:sugar lactone lactonase YvrE
MLEDSAIIKEIIFKRLFLKVGILTCLLCFNIGNKLVAQDYSYARPSRTEIMQKLVEKNPNHDHPRLFARSSDFEKLQQTILTDPLVAGWYNGFLATADKYVDTDVTPPDYLATVQIQNGYLNSDYTRSFPDKMTTLAFAYQVTKKQKYADRAYKEMQALINIPDWTSTKYGYHLNTADIMFGFGICYDWCYNAFTTEQRTTLRTNIINKGLGPLLKMYNANPNYTITTGIGNPFSDGNHNPWDNGYASIAALSFAEEAPDTTSEILERALVVLENFAPTLGPDGASVEGPGYGNGSVCTYIKWMAALESTIGTSYNYLQVPGILEAAYFSPYLNGPVKALNFHDSGTDSKEYLPVSFFIANKIPDAALGNMHKADIVNAATRSIIFDLFWYTPDLYGTSTLDLPLDKYFRGNVQTGSFRSSYSDPNAMFLAFHGGENNVGHMHYDIGQFNIDAMGLNWALDLGTEKLTYDAQLLSTSGASVWLLYRIATQGHNTLLINPSKTFSGQSKQAYNPVTEFVSKDSGGFSILDMTAAYSTQATSAKRGFALTENRSRIIVQDEITLKEKSTLWWNMHTRASIKVSDDGKTAILSQVGKRLRASLISPADGTFLAMKAEALSESYSNYAETANTGIQRLSIKLEGISSDTIMLEFTPINSDSDLNLPTLPLIPLADWSEPRATANIAPTIKYEGSPIALELNKAMTPLTPVNTGGAVPVTSDSGFLITPETLPTGLIFDHHTGIISGIPTALADLTMYTVKAINPYGNGLANIKLQVVKVLPPRFSYPDEDMYYQTGQSIDPIIPQNPGGPVATGGLSISPALPKGLGIDSITGIISGTPVETSLLQDYTITASNEGGMLKSVVRIGTAKTIPPVIGYAKDSYLFSPQTTIDPIIPIVTKGEVPATVFGTVSTSVAGANWPQSMTVDRNNNKLYVGARGSYQVLTMTLPSSALSVLAGTGATGSVDGQGTQASFGSPFGLAIHPKTGDIYVADATNHKIRKITPEGVVSTYAGTGTAGAVDGAIATATFNQPQGLSFDTDGSLYVLQYANASIRKINAAGTQVSTISKSVKGNSAYFAYANGYFYVSEISGNAIDKVNLSDGSLALFSGSASSVSGYEDGAGADARFYAPRGIAVDSTGNIYVADYSNCSVRRISSTGEVTTVAGTGASGDVDGIGTNASFKNPASIALDGLGNLYVGDAGTKKIRKIVLTGYTITPELPSGLIFDRSTGIISGTPKAAALLTDYTITGYNVNGSSSTNIKIGVGDVSAVHSVMAEKGLYQVYVTPDHVIKIVGNVSKGTKAFLYSLQGKLLLSLTLNDGNEHSISVSTIESGLYLLRIGSSDGYKAYKILLHAYNADCYHLNPHSCNS